MVFSAEVSVFRALSGSSPARPLPPRGRAAAVLIVLPLLWLLLGVPPPALGAGASCLRAVPLFQVTTAGGIALRQPSDLTVHESQLFVLDDLNGRVVGYGLSGEYLFSIPLPGDGATSYLGFDVGGDDNLYLAASEEGRIFVVNRNGRTLREFQTGEKEQASEPAGLKVSRGQCLVVDNERNAVMVFDLEGKLLMKWGEPGEGPAGFRYPFRITQDGLGRIIVTDTLNSRVKVFTPKGEPLLDFGEFGVTEGTLFRPAGLASWGTDKVMVADNYHGAVQLFDLRGEYQATVCAADGAPILFENPMSLAVRGSTLFVLETGAGRVSAFEVR